MNRPLQIAFFGSSLVSAYWNSAATYYRGILRALALRGHTISFYGPDARDRQHHWDIPAPDWARVVVFSSTDETGVQKALQEAAAADLIIKASGVGVFDDLLETGVLELRGPGRPVLFWDADAPATLDRVHNNPGDPFASLIGSYDLILTCGGGEPVVTAYETLGAKRCVPIYNALDPTMHYPVLPDSRFEGDLGFLGDRLPDREAGVERFFLHTAASLPWCNFILGGSGWENKRMSANVHYLGHVYTSDHNAFNCTPRAVLDISHENTARYGLAPATRVFEAAGAGACLITDAWQGIEQFLEPGTEILVARDGFAVADYLQSLTPQQACRIGQAARRRVLAEHTYEHRVRQLEELFSDAYG